MDVDGCRAGVGAGVPLAGVNDSVGFKRGVDVPVAGFRLLPFGGMKKAVLAVTV